VIIRSKRKTVIKILRIYEGELDISYEGLSPTEKWLLNRSEDQFHKSVTGIFSDNPYLVPLLLIIIGFISILLVTIFCIINEEFQINLLQIIVAMSFLGASLFSSEIFGTINFIDYISDFRSSLRFSDYENISRVEKLANLRKNQFLLISVISLILAILFDEILLFLFSLPGSIADMIHVSTIGIPGNEIIDFFSIVSISSIILVIIALSIFKGPSLLLSLSLKEESSKVWNVLERKQLSTWKKDSALSLEYYWKKQLDNYTVTGNTRKIIFCKGILASLYLEMSEYSEAKVLLDQLYDYAVKTDDKRGIAAALASIGEYYMTMGDYNRAIDYFNESQSFILNSNLIYSIALAHIGNNDLYKAEKLLAENFNVDNSLTIINTYWSFLSARIQHEKENWGNAIEEYQNTLKMANKLVLNKLSAQICLHLADVFLKKYMASNDEESLVECESLVTRSFAYAKREFSWSLAIESLIMTSIISITRLDFSQAEARISQAIIYAQEKGLLKYKKQTSEILSKIEEFKTRTPLQLFSSLDRSLNQEEMFMYVDSIKKLLKEVKK